MKNAVLIQPISYGTFSDKLAAATEASTQRAAKLYHQFAKMGYEVWVMYGVVRLKNIPNSIAIESTLRCKILSEGGVPDEKIISIEVVNTLFEIQTIFAETWRRGIYKRLHKVVGICGEYHAPAVRIGLKCFYRPAGAEIELDIFPGELECEPNHPVEDQRSPTRWKLLSLIRRIAFSLAVILYTKILFRSHADVGMFDDTR